MNNILDPQIDIPSLKSEYQKDQRIRIDNFLTSEFATEVADSVSKDLKYDYIYLSKDKNQVVPEEQMMAMDLTARQELQTELMQQASRGVGFLYAGYKMQGDKVDAAPTPLKKLFDMLNSDEMLNFMTSITGSPELKSADAQYTRYTSGNYLTRHKDDIEAEGRRLAFVLGLSPSWHPDWGGLLQFYKENGVPRDAWEPRINSLALFDVKHIHSVTYVAPHAAAPRFELTGWFRNI
jgi:Rps23 Pro-64 3,4-dihydroxylase Tpa1-like proline 4-hydroxylase